ALGVAHLELLVDRECAGEFRVLRDARESHVASLRAHQDAARASDGTPESANSETVTTSSAEQPRDRSFAGFARPDRIGPYAAQPPSRCTSLYPMFAASRSGKISTFACPATIEPGAFACATSGTSAASAWSS